MKHCYGCGYDQQMMYNEMYGMEMIPCYYCGYMQQRPLYSMHQKESMMQPVKQNSSTSMREYYPKQPMMPPRKKKCSEKEPVAGMEDYFEDKAPKCKEKENLLNVMNDKYPELCDEAKETLKQLMEIDFAILELTLYLDTHPEDRRALTQHNFYVEKRKPLVMRLERLYGPLTILAKSDYPWAWLNQPWPWRIEY